MYTTLLVVHFVSLALGMGIGFAMKPLSALAKRQPSDVDRLKFMAQLKPLGQISGLALLLLLITGIAMVVLRWLDVGLSLFFTLKMIAVAILVLAIFMIRRMQAKALQTQDVRYLDKADAYGAVSGIMSLLAVVFAVLMFH